MKIIGLTGSMASGKSTAARLLRENFDIPLFDADGQVHYLMSAQGGAAEKVAKIMADKTGEKKEFFINAQGDIERGRIRLFLSHAGVLEGLEALLHPLVAEARKAFLKHHEDQGDGWVILDIPLLFEGGAAQTCDKIICIHTPYEKRFNRLRARGLDETMIKSLEARQWHEDKKAAASDYVIKGFLGEETLLKDLQNCMEDMTDGVNRL